jgi:hypothetical protein
VWLGINHIEKSEHMKWKGKIREVNEMDLLSQLMVLSAYENTARLEGNTSQLASVGVHTREKLIKKEYDGGADTAWSKY